MVENLAERRGTILGPLLAALFLPPLGLYLDRGIGRDFWIGVALTAAFFVPGVLYAVTVIVRHRSRG